MTDANFLREIDEDLRRDQFKKLWDRYGPYAIALAVLIVLATAGWRGWQWYEARESAKAGARFEQALSLAETGKQNEAEQEFAALAKDAPAGYRLLSRFTLAGQSGRRDAAAGAAAFDAIAADNSVDPTLRDLARLRAGMLLVDTAPVSEIASRIEPLTGAAAPFRNSAREVLALAKFRAGDKAGARALFNEILSDPSVSSSLANRAQVMQALTADAASAKPGSATQ